MTAAQVTQVADEVFLVSGIASNWILLREGRDLTLVDAGYPRDLAGVLSSIAQIGGRPEELRGVLITHAHVDHVGSLPALHARHPVPLLAHERELPMLRGEVHEQAGAKDVLPHCWRPRIARWSLTVARAGGLARIRLPQAQALRTGIALDLPGAPVAVACPGHTSGHSVLHLPRVGAVVSGDALVTGHPVLTRRGPQLLPAMATHDPARTLRTLDAISGLDAETLLPGHGPVWRGAMPDAVAQARAAAPRGFATGAG